MKEVWFSFMLFSRVVKRYLSGYCSNIIGEKPAFQKGNFSANFLPLFEELASVKTIHCLKPSLFFNATNILKNGTVLVNPFLKWTFS
jgi:hypothetical protein